MKQFLLFTLSLLITTTTAFSQVVHPCGTPPIKSKWLKDYQKSPQTYRKGADTLIFVPLSIHSVGTDAGLSHISPGKILDGLCKLNDDYTDAKIQFFVEGEINKIDTSAYFNHTDIALGYQMMINNNIPHTINCYHLANPAGNGGYNLPSARAIAMSNGSTNASSFTWAHEIGHNLSIQHPFLGWEGNASNWNWNDTAPTQVFYDYTSFKPIWYNPADTTIIDSIQVELVDGSNCHLAADGFCDTKPDYLALGSWQCNGNNESDQLQRDPHGTQFRSDGTLIMTYSSQSCTQRFTPEQIAAMRANLYSDKPDYLYNQNPFRDTITQTPTIVMPVANNPVQFNNVDLEWTSVEGATHYLVQISRFNTFAIMAEEFITQDTTAIISSLDNNRNYKWRVRPFNWGYTCAPYTTKEEFFTDDFIATDEIEGIESVAIYPTLFNSQQTVNIEINAKTSLFTQLAIYNLAGQTVHTEQIDIQAGFNQLNVKGTKFRGSGMFIIALHTENGTLVEK